ncbi:hypothetical protein JTE90_022755 [Oedothorax gibbosus]|uniref:G-protein coupled receptors family 1 profile domain-containing protein n=1 Tax=Oedothorax gibbosus TaxID=931172 RepID=A0AAV6UAV2_9ARAC|nr:hypothetical protein JTE90_022755 [Oedothorax gibbosus]
MEKETLNHKDIVSDMEDGNATFPEASCRPMNGTFNSNSCQRSPFFNGLGCLATVIIALASIFGNMAVIIGFFFDETLRSQVGNRLIVYLSCTDTLTAILVMLPSALSVALNYWPFGIAACKMHAFFNYSFSCSSSANVAFISVDRAIAVAYPLKYQSIVTDKVIFGFMGWLIFQGSTIGTILGLLKWSGYDNAEGVCAIDYTANDTQAVFYLFNSACIVCYFIPVSIISVSTFLIINIAYRSGKRDNQPMFVRRQKNSHMKKTIKSMIVVVATYYICFTPYAMSKLAKVLLRVDMPPWLNYATTITIFINSASNPFIYAILRKDYREAFKKIPNMIIK